MCINIGYIIGIRDKLLDTAVSPQTKHLSLNGDPFQTTVYLAETQWMKRYV